MSNMTVDEYQKFTNEIAIYPKVQTDEQIFSAMFLGLGLAGETGEVLEKIKKWHRDGTFDKEDMVKELGDVCWYLAQLCTVIDIDFSSVLATNVDKLQSRKERDALSGSGDDR